MAKRELTLPRRYVVRRGSKKVLEITGAPGPLISKRAPPPAAGREAAWHPFLSATAYVSEEETRLRDALNQSRSLSEYLDALRAMGFRVEEAR
jgi:hypothetical protein